MQGYMLNDSRNSGNNKYFKLLYTNVISFTAIILLACCFGMLVTALAIGLYYTCLFPTLPAASLESPGMYDYASDYQEWRIKKDVSHQEDEEEKRMEQDLLSDDYDTTRDNDILRSKRNGTTPPPDEVVKSENTTPTTGDPARTVAVTDLVVNISNTEFNRSTTAAVPPTTEGLDFGFSNRFIDSVFSFAADSNLKESLGLCRSNVNFKTPQFNGSVFPTGDATEILSCINVIMKNMTVTNLCAQLDDETEAYLKWLVLTGEPRHKPVTPANTDDFLFPPTCGSGAADMDVDIKQAQWAASPTPSKTKPEQEAQSEKPISSTGSTQ